MVLNFTRIVGRELSRSLKHILPVPTETEALGMKYLAYILPFRVDFKRLREKKIKVKPLQSGRRYTCSGFRGTKVEKAVVPF